MKFLSEDGVWKLLTNLKALFGNKLDATAQAADSAKLDGLDSADFLRSTALRITPTSNSFLALITELCPNSDMHSEVIIPQAWVAAASDKPPLTGSVVVKVVRAGLGYADMQVMNVGLAKQRFFRTTRNLNDPNPTWIEPQWEQMGMVSDIDAAQFAVNVPNLSVAPRNIFTAPNNNQGNGAVGPWTMTANGFIRVKVGTQGNIGQWNRFQVIVNGREVANFSAAVPNNTQAYYADSGLIPVRLGDVVSVNLDMGYNGNPMWVDFIPPIAIQAPTVNETYSTSQEINTGKTWINGKPIYRQAFSKTKNIALVTPVTTLWNLNNSTDLLAVSTGIDAITDVFMAIGKSNDWYTSLIPMYGLIDPNNSGSWFSIVLDYDRRRVDYYTASQARPSTIMSTHGWIEYTKP